MHGRVVIVEEYYRACVSEQYMYVGIVSHGYVTNPTKFGNRPEWIPAEPFMHNKF